MENVWCFTYLLAYVDIILEEQKFCIALGLCFLLCLASGFFSTIGFEDDFSP